MKNARFEYAPLGNLIKGLENTDESNLEKLKAELIEQGFDPDAFISKITAQVNALSKESRLSWMKVGDAAQTKFNSVVKSVTSWTTRTVSEIDKAFDDVLNGQHGPAASLQLRTAFSNVTELTSQSKATMLDNIEVLRTLLDKDRKPPTL